MSQFSVRQKGMRKTVEIVSPYENPFEATIIKAGNAEDIARLNSFSKVRMILNQNSPNEIVQERDVPMGDLQMFTIMLCLRKWNIADESGRVYPVTEENVKELLDPRERRWLHDEVIKANPMWGNAEEEKNDSEPSLSLSSGESSEMSLPESTAETTESLSTS